MPHTKSCGCPTKSPCTHVKSCGCPTSVISCGCHSHNHHGHNHGHSKNFGVDCCQIPVQPAPEICCETHDIKCIAGVCLEPKCDVVSSTEDFFLEFSNVCNTLPVDSNNIFFFHVAAGTMRVVGFDGVRYTVRLLDPTRAGGLIQKGDCVLIQVIPEQTFVNTSLRCLCGKFVAPQLNQNETLFIENGAGIPIGATVVFTFEGETGSYVVISFVSSDNNTYAYEVQNTGNGHTPGLIIDGGDVGDCSVPIDIVTVVDLCDLAETNIADTITACVNGSPRGLVPTGEGDVITGTDALTWELRKITGLDCCVVLDGCLKFSGNVCPTGDDTVIIKDVNKDCFEAAWQEVLDQQFPFNNAGPQTNMPMNINGVQLVVTDFDSGTCSVTFALSDPDALAGGPIEFEEGTQVCLGECCDSCLNGPRTTSHRATGQTNDELRPLYAFTTTTTELEFETGVKHRYLVGFEHGTTPLTIIVLELDDTYNDNPEGNIGKPLVTDPLLFRTKICNDDVLGCDQTVDWEWNFEIAFHPIPFGVRVHYEFGRFAQGAQTLADNTTPNPFFSISTQACGGDYMEGPSSLDSTAVIGGTSIGLGNTTQEKIEPFLCGFFKDYMYLEKCNCGFSVVWLYIETEVLPGFTEAGFFDAFGTIRQRLRYYDANSAVIPANDSDSQGFNS